MTGVVALWRGPTHNFPGAVEFVIAVLVIIVVIFIRVYGPRRPTWGPTGHSARRRGADTAHRVAGQGEHHDHDHNHEHGHQVKAKRRPNRH